MRRWVIVAAVVAGALVGATVTAAVRDESGPVVLPSARPAVVDEAPIVTPAEGVLLMWVPGGLPDGLTRRLGAAPGLGTLSVALGDTVWMVSSTDGDGRAVDTLDPGFAIPLEAVALDCATWEPLVPLAEAEALCGLAAGEALLGTTSARLRRVGVGGTITLDGGASVRVAGVIDDEAVGAAELVLARPDAAAAGVHTPRYALGRYSGDRAAVEAAVRTAAGDVELRIRGPGETTWLRHGDAVLPQSILKEELGEFAARRGDDGVLVLDRRFAEEQLEVADLPVLGRVRCHRQLVHALEAALAELAGRALLTDLDRRASGCWNPRVIAGTNQPSRHAWGAAIDLVPLPDDPAVIEVMERHGFSWGGRWVQPDPVHFEFIRPGKP